MGKTETLFAPFVIIFERKKCFENSEIYTIIFLPVVVLTLKVMEQKTAFKHKKHIQNINKGAILLLVIKPCVSLKLSLVYCIYAIKLILKQKIFKKMNLFSF